MPTKPLDTLPLQLTTGTEEEIRNFKVQRKEALTRLDRVWARQQCEITGQRISEKALEIWMHKARYACLEVDKSYRFTSKQWLAERNFGAFDGPLLPAGALPL